MKMNKTEKKPDKPGSECKGCPWGKRIHQRLILCMFPECVRVSRNVKKKRIVKLEPQTVELFAEVLSKLRPPPPLTVSQWADKYRVLSAESSAEPGRWHTEKAPYQRAIMDAIGDPHVRSVVVMSAAQIGKTDAFILNRWATTWTMHHVR